MSNSSQEDLVRRISVAQAVLDRVIHTTDNLDEKVGRVFTSMSFLTVGATILFTSFVADKLLFDVQGVSVVSLLFLGFVLSVSIATAFMLQAMGPRFHLNPWRSQSTKESLGPIPTGYADKIASMKEAEWTEYFKNVNLDDLYQKWYAESLHEAYKLSKKVERKVEEMRGAQRAFLFAIIFLFAMLLAAVYPLL